MGENGNTAEFKMKLIDKLIVGLIGFASLVVIIITIIMVHHKYQKIYEEQLRRLHDIPYNETYRYYYQSDSLNIYKDIKKVGGYKCSNDCSITKFLSNQFIIDNDDLIPIISNGSIVLFSVSSNNVKMVLDDVPLNSINNKYGIIKMNGKSGVINKKGDIILDCLYSDIDIDISHIVTLLDNTIYIFDDSAHLLLTRPISVTGDISISEKNNYMYINIVGVNTVTLIFDLKNNVFVN